MTVTTNRKRAGCTDNSRYFCGIRATTILPGRAYRSRDTARRLRRLPLGDSGSPTARPGACGAGLRPAASGHMPAGDARPRLRRGARHPVGLAAGLRTLAAKAQRGLQKQGHSGAAAALSGRQDSGISPIPRTLFGAGLSGCQAVRRPGLSPWNRTIHGIQSGAMGNRSQSACRLYGQMFLEHEQ